MSCIRLTIFANTSSSLADAVGFSVYASAHAIGELALLHCQHVLPDVILEASADCWPHSMAHRGLPQRSSLSSAALDLTELAAAANILCNCEPEICNNRFLLLKLQTQSMPISVKYQITNTSRFELEFAVMANYYTTTTLTMTLSNKSRESNIAQLLGVLYRRAIVLYYPGEMCSITPAHIAVPFVDTSWTPFKLTTFICHLATQTHSFAHSSLLLIPEDTPNCTITASKTSESAALSVHLQYKGQHLQVVVRRQHQPKLVQTLAYPPTLTLLVENSHFQWKGSAALITLLANAIWRHLIVIL